MVQAVLMAPTAVTAAVALGVTTPYVVARMELPVATVRRVNRPRHQPTGARLAVGAALAAGLSVVLSQRPTWQHAGLISGVEFAAWIYLAVVLAWVDLDQRRIPRFEARMGVIGLGAVWGVHAVVLGEWSRFLSACVAGLVWWAVLRVGVVVAGIGRGDPVLGGLLGLGLGWMGWYLATIGLAAGFVVGGVVALVLLAARLVHRQTPMPLGTFLVTGATLTTLALS